MSIESRTTMNDLTTTIVKGGAGGALLVRPGCFVAWRAVGADAEPERTLAEALARVLGRDSP